MSGKYLKHAKIDAFGAFSNRVVGPFGPHLNVVFGQNEAGKTTLSQFVGGVLFGWEEARGLRNTYKPANAERSGTLVFADEQTGATPMGYGGTFPWRPTSTAKRIAPCSAFQAMSCAA